MSHLNVSSKNSSCWCHKIVFIPSQNVFSICLVVERLQGPRKSVERVWADQRGESIFELWDFNGRRANTWIGEGSSDGKCCFIFLSALPKRFAEKIQ